MKIIESYYDRRLKNDPESLTHLYEFMMYDIPDSIVVHIENLLLPGCSVAMFSGSWRLNLNATYLEARMFKDSLLQFHKSTLFVEPNETKLFDLTLSKLSPTNLMILHNDWWTEHAPIDQLLNKLDQFLKYVKPQKGQIICTLPLVHVNFNKLVMSLDDLTQQTDSTIVDDSLIIVRK